MVTSGVRASRVVASLSSIMWRTVSWASGVTPLTLSWRPSSARTTLWAVGVIPSIREEVMASLRRRNCPAAATSGDVLKWLTRASAWAASSCVVALKVREASLRDPGT